MKILNPLDAEHSIRLIPRSKPDGVLSLILMSELTGVSEFVSCSYSFQDGYLDVAFEKTFTDKGRFAFTLSDANGIIYRGKVYVTEDLTQNYKQTKDIYEY